MENICAGDFEPTNFVEVAEETPNRPPIIGMDFNELLWIEKGFSDETIYASILVLFFHPSSGADSHRQWMNEHIGWSNPFNGTKRTCRPRRNILIFGPMDSAARRFHAIVREGIDWEQIAHMVETDGLDVDCTDQFGNTALMVAALHGHSTCCSLLLELGAQINRQNRFGASPLNIALSNQHEQTALLLLRRGANPNNCAKNGSIPLLLAIQLGLTDMCRELLKYGADLDVQLTDGANAVFLACQNGNLDLLKLLAASGANLGMFRNDHTNALLMACQLGHTAIVRELLTCYTQRTTAVDDNKAIRKSSNHADIIRRCLKRANAKGFSEIVELLMEHEKLPEAPT